MAEYQVVMHHLGRMCETYPSCSDGCPLQEEPNVCFLSAKHLSTEKIKATEQAVMSWAAEHPEPVYQTWGEWFVSRKMLPEKWDNLTSAYMNVGCVPSLLHSPIPADLAEKLGLEPKEG